MLSRLFDQSLAAALCDASRTLPRGRSHHCMHRDDGDAVHRLFVAMQPASYIQPHRHLDPFKAESLVVVRGMLGFLEFDDLGGIVSCARIGEHGDGMGIDIPPGCWHGIVALEPDTLFFETKAGPYRALARDEGATWAPGEDDPAAQATLQRLKGFFSA
jgi:cupin fold WbuC family metalloprotein